MSDEIWRCQKCDSLHMYTEMQKTPFGKFYLCDFCWDDFKEYIKKGN